MPLFDAAFYKRLKLYGIGFLFGAVLVHFLFNGRACKMPGTIKKEELGTQNIQLSKHAKCRMQCRGIDENEIKQVLQNGSINYKKSDAQDKPCPTYAMEGKTKDGTDIRLVVADCDTISKIVTVINLDLDRDTCFCN